jgi:hypothetical protein
MKIIKYYDYSDSLSYKKEFEELILKTIATESIIKLYICSGKIRKYFHKFAEENNLYHVSYCDETMIFDTNISYWCDTCLKYVKRINATINHCCGDDECGEYVILCDCSNIIADDFGAYDDVPAKETITNNIIVISNKIELLADIFKKKKIKNPIKWIKNREKKFA